MLPIENMSKILLELTLRPIPRHCFMSGKKILHYWLIWLELPLLSSLSSSLDNTNKHTRRGWTSAATIIPNETINKQMNVASSTTKTNPKIRSGDQEHTVAAAQAMSTMAKCQENHYWRKCARRSKQLRAHMRAIRDRRARTSLWATFTPYLGATFWFDYYNLAKYLQMSIIT